LLAVGVVAYYNYHQQKHEQHQIRSHVSPHFKPDWTFVAWGMTALVISGWYTRQVSCLNVAANFCPISSEQVTSHIGVNDTKKQWWGHWTRPSGVGEHSSITTGPNCCVFLRFYAISCKRFNCNFKSFLFWLFYSCFDYFRSSFLAICTHLLLFEVIRRITLTHLWSQNTDLLACFVDFSPGLRPSVLVDTDKTRGLDRLSLDQRDHPASKVRSPAPLTRWRESVIESEVRRAPKRPFNCRHVNFDWLQVGSIFSSRASFTIDWAEFVTRYHADTDY